MIAVETKIHFREMGRRLPALEIRFQLVDGSRESFVQNEVETAESILARIDPANLFHQFFNPARIVVADEYSKSVFVCSQINRVPEVPANTWMAEPKW